VGNLIAELLLRLVKPAIALVLAFLLYVVVGGLGVGGSIELFLLCWLSAVAFILLVQEGPL
jgi:hypothetical protein